MISDVVDFGLLAQQLCTMFKIDTDGNAVCLG